MARKRDKSNTATMSKAKEETKIYAQLVALETEDRLNGWEQNFVADISGKFYDGKDLHPNSVAKLEEIYRRYN